MCTAFLQVSRRLQRRLYKELMAGNYGCASWVGLVPVLETTHHFFRGAAAAALLRCAAPVVLPPAVLSPAVSQPAMLRLPWCPVAHQRFGQIKSTLHPYP